MLPKGLAARFGSGLSHHDHTSPQQVATLLSRMALDPAFVDPLAIAGETGTLGYEISGTRAQGRSPSAPGSDAEALVAYDG